MIDIDRVDIDKIVVSSKDSFGKKDSCKNFIGYMTNYIKPLCLKLHQMNGYI